MPLLNYCVLVTDRIVLAPRYPTRTERNVEVKSADPTRSTLFRLVKSYAKQAAQRKTSARYTLAIAANESAFQFPRRSRECRCHSEHSEESLRETDIESRTRFFTPLRSDRNDNVPIETCSAKVSRWRGAVTRGYSSSSLSVSLSSSPSTNSSSSSSARSSAVTLGGWIQAMRSSGSLANETSSGRSR